MRAAAWVFSSQTMAVCPTSLLFLEKDGEFFRVCVCVRDIDQPGEVSPCTSCVWGVWAGRRTPVVWYSFAAGYPERNGH